MVGKAWLQPGWCFRETLLLRSVFLPAFLLKLFWNHLADGLE